MRLPQSQKIILFDGLCGLCNKSVDWLLKKDTNEVFMFSPIQGEFASTLKIDHSLIENPESIIYLDQKRLFSKSSAALRIAKELPFPWKLLIVFYIIPNFLRDPIYEYIANNRYAWFGKSDSCSIPSPQEKHRFIV